MNEDTLFFSRIREGDRSAFEFIFNKYGEQLYYYALGVLGKKEVAEDIVQDVFTYVWHNCRKIELNGSLSVYLAKAVKHACINHKLHEKVKKRYQKELLSTLSEEQEIYTEERLEYLRLKLIELLDRLPSKCRDIFVLGCVDGLTYKEIAERLGISVNTVKTQIKYAYKKLRKNSEGLDADFLVWTLLFGFTHMMK